MKHDLIAYKVGFEECLLYQSGKFYPYYMLLKLNNKLYINRIDGRYVDDNIPIVLQENYLEIRESILIDEYVVIYSNICKQL